MYSYNNAHQKSDFDNKKAQPDAHSNLRPCVISWQGSSIFILDKKKPAAFDPHVNS